ncbi:MarR family transcriptional regulator [Helicobacter jaachi]|uniref:MarR family transcriptional regulator n=1 Tax=Helicobacter jaachi TaxID=1677920 RepID=A0A4U8TBJ8_9HELI|nr:MarR family transcriptional regulator [Helicobacter jaachi]TLD97281.1 MarR family transcriptional regulator [Helicobacter jaachi]
MQCNQHFIGHHIGKTARCFQVFFINELKAYNLGFEQGIILFIIAENPQAHINFVAEELHKNKATISREVNSLISKGFCLKKQAPNDKRTMLLELTPSGKNVLNVIENKRKKLEAQLQKNLSQEEIDTCIDVLECMYQTIQDNLKESPRCN